MKSVDKIGSIFLVAGLTLFIAATIMYQYSLFTYLIGWLLSIAMVPVIISILIFIAGDDSGSQ
jgi:hypothetical protein